VKEQENVQTEHRTTRSNGQQQSNLSTAIRRANGTTKRTIDRKMFICEPDEAPKGICMIERGVVAQEIGVGKKRLVTAFSGRGDLLFASRLLSPTPGDPSAFLGHSTLALTDAEVAEVPWDVARKIPALVAVAAEQNEQERTALERRVFATSYKSVKARLAALIVKLAGRFGVPFHGEGTIIKAPVTHEHLSDAIGSTRETVTLTLGELENRKRVKGEKALIYFDKRNIVVVDIAGLRALAAS
jgi:CRP-like cAMP-binding protein